MMNSRNVGLRAISRLGLAFLYIEIYGHDVHEECEGGKEDRFTYIQYLPSTLK
jgi:hypothetical protein